MSELQDIGLKFGTDKATHHKYLDFYAEYMPKRDFSGRLLEIGIRDGSSLRMWHEYYPAAEIIGIDIEQYDWTIEGVTMLCMDGTKPDELAKLGMFDVIIDDGSHYTEDQQLSFDHLYYSQLKPSGIYILEDLHTSLRPEYVNSPLTTLEYLDKLKLECAKYWREPQEPDSMSFIIKAGQ